MSRLLRRAGQQALRAFRPNARSDGAQGQDAENARRKLLCVDRQLQKLRDFEEIAGGELFDETLENTLDAFLSETQPVKLNAEVVEDSQPDAQPAEETPGLLQKMLDEAVAEERYEDAADLRDKLKKLSEKNK